MANTMNILALGLIIGYILYRFMNKKSKKKTHNYSDILTNDQYKVKGQWDK